MDKNKFSDKIKEIQSLCDKDRFYRPKELFDHLKERDIKLNLIHLLKLHNQLIRRKNAVKVEEIYKYYLEDNK